MRVNGSEALMLTLLKEGVDTIFGYPGGAIMPIYDAHYSYRDRLKHILTCHEQGAIHAAEAYARVSGKPGVCFATSGPGATNLITGLADALIDSTPLVCITGQVHSSLIGSDAFQETDVLGISMAATKWNCQISDPKDIPEVLSKAFYIASHGRPGPVLIDITKDAQMGMTNFMYKKCDHVRSYHPRFKPNPENIAKAVALINKAEKPFLLVGQGVSISGGEDALERLMEKAQIPAACTLMGLSAVRSDNPLNMGMLGMHGNYGPNILTNECDLLIAVGMRFDDRVTGDVNSYAKQAKVIHIDIDPAEIDKIVKTDVAIVADAHEALEGLLNEVKAAEHSEWINKFYELRKQEEEKVFSKDLHSDKECLTMAEVVDLCSDASGEQAIVVTDVGQHQMVAARYSRFKNTKSFLSSGGLGTMGFGLPAAIGAKLASPEREVILFVGDGGFQMTIQELGTIFRYNIPVKIVLLNNNYLGMVRQWQELFFEERYSSTPMENPDFQTIAKGYKVRSRHVSKREDLKNAVSEMLSHQSAYILEVDVENKGMVFPMIPAGAAVTDILLEA